MGRSLEGQFFSDVRKTAKWQEAWSKFAPEGIEDRAKNGKVPWIAWITIEPWLPENAHDKPDWNHCIEIYESIHGAAKAEYLQAVVRGAEFLISNNLKRNWGMTTHEDTQANAERAEL